MKENQNGSITVFLSLILLLIMAVIMTTVEAARVNVAKISSERAFITAMDSVLAEFYLPLFQEYHIFGLDGGYGTDILQEDTIKMKLKDYMEYTFEPNKDLFYIANFLPVKNVNLFGIETKDIEINKINNLSDYNGELFVSQAVSYMKYREIGDGIEYFLEKMSVIEETEVAKTVLQEKYKTEESLYGMNQDILSLMGLIDGISISESGVKVDKAGKIVIKENFVKKLCLLPITQSNLGINNELVFLSLQGNFVQPIPILDLISMDINSLISNLALRDKARITYHFLSLIDQSEIKDKKELAQLNKDIQEAKVDYLRCIETENALLTSASSNISSLSNIVNSTLKVVQSAIPIINTLILKQDSITTEILKYEAFLEENKDMLSDEFYQGLSEDLKELSKYKKNASNESQDLGNYDFQGMKETLQNNEALLLGIQEKLNITLKPEEVELQEALNSIVTIKNSMQQYSHNKLVFDYSSITKPVESDSFFQGIKSFLEDGIMGLLIEDMNSISSKTISTTDLPSMIHQIEINEEPEDASASYSNLGLNSGTKALTDTSAKAGQDMDAMSTILEGGEQIGQLILLQEYLLEHFSSYKQGAMEEAITALDYELEYILMGKSSDYDNLKAVISRILLIRTVMNLITLMGDSTKREEAGALALTFVGFTGLPILVTIVKTLIISVWAFAESFVDVAALLKGISVPILKNSKDIQLGLQELLLINKEMIKSKVSNMKDKAGILDLSYEDYLRIFLFIESQEKKSFRAMDLIQENLQIKYEDTFYIRNCIFGFQSIAQFQMEAKFVALPFVNEMLGYQNNSYKFQSNKEYSY